MEVAVGIAAYMGVDWRVLWVGWRKVLFDEEICVPSFRGCGIGGRNMWVHWVRGLRIRTKRCELNSAISKTIIMKGVCLL